jgi:hypothetical protein
MARDEDWRRFGFTVRVILASAFAQEESMGQRQGIDRERERFTFRLLAAATRQQAALPAEGWFDTRRALRATCAANHGEIRLQLQAEGFAALRQVARRSGRLVAENGSFNVAIGFDETGRSLMVLADSDTVRQGLCSFELMFDDDG